MRFWNLDEKQQPLEICLKVAPRRQIKQAFCCALEVSC